MKHMISFYSKYVSVVPFSRNTNLTNLNIHTLLKSYSILRMWGLWLSLLHIMKHNDTEA